MSDERNHTPLPTGTVTFLRTDVEGSMGLVRSLGARWDVINAAHLGILRAAVDRNGGVCVRTEGDALLAAFPEAGAALRAAIEGQRGLDAHPWPDEGRILVRMAVHSGEAHLAGDDYGGFDVNRAARIAAVGHGGQIVVSGTTQALVASSLPPDITLRDLGRHALKDVPTPEALFQVDAPGRRTDFPPLRVAGSTLGNLPDRVTSFVGRARDVAELSDLLERSRLITLTGPGGIGKTSLAVEVARQGAVTAPDGAWFVALDGISDPAMVKAVIARTLGLFDGSERSAAEALPGYVADRSLLVVLDNYEQVLEAAGDVADLLRASPRSRIVVTSRAPLRLAGEQEYPVRPLRVGDARPASAATDPTDDRDAASRLFIERARAVRPSWEPGPEAPLVTEICESLDGLPLGIELAAAKTSILPIRAIRDRLAAHLPLPGSGPRDAPARQRTLEGAIEWSHELLAPEDQRALHELSVFEGTFDAEQAERVVGEAGSGGATDVLDRLVTLAEQSLIARDPTLAGEEPLPMATGIRFGMLNTVQAFAARRLADDGREAELRSRHLRAFVDLADAAFPHLNTGEQPVWLDRLSLDDANLRAALRWSIAAGDADSALRLIGALWRYWLLDGRLAEGAEWVESVFAMPGAERPTRVRVRALAAAGGIAYWGGAQEAAIRWYEAEYDLASSLDDSAGIADAAFNLGASSFVRADLPRSLEYADEAHRRYEALGDEIGINRTAWGMANLTMMREPRDAIPDLERLLRRAEELGDAPWVPLFTGNLAWASFAIGDDATAGRWAMRSMRGYYAIRDVASTTISLPAGALTAIGLDRPTDAATLLGAFQGLCERYGVRPPLGLETIIRKASPLERAQAALDPVEFATAFERGRRMTLAEAMELIAELGETVNMPPVSGSPPRSSPG